MNDKQDSTFLAAYGLGLCFTKEYLEGEPLPVIDQMMADLALKTGVKIGQIHLESTYEKERSFFAKFIVRQPHQLMKTNFDNMTRGGKPLEEIEDERHARRNSLIVMAKVPALGDRCPYDQDLIVTAYKHDWEDREGIHGTVTYTDGAEEFDEKFWVPKNQARGHTADIRFDEFG